MKIELPSYRIFGQSAAGTTPIRAESGVDAGASAMDGSEARDLSLLGIGLYTVSDVARLTGISPGRLRRWLRGYAYRASQGQVTMAPLWHSQVPEVNERSALGSAT